MIRHENAEQWYASPRGVAELWAGVLLAPLAWSLHLSVSYFLAGMICGSSGVIALAVASLIALTIASAGGWLAWRNHVGTGREWPRGDDDGVVVRSRFLAIGGMLLSGLSALLIVVQSIPVLVLPPCL